MNEAHLKFCASPEWAQFVADDLLPWALGTETLGDEVLEIGAGPGMTTDVLRRKVAHLTAVEVDQTLADALTSRLRGTNVDVVRGDGAHLPFDAGTFDTATCFTMLHHVPSIEQQDQLLAEARRVLRPGGFLLGTDSVGTPSLQELHLGDTYTPVDPVTLDARLLRAGFAVSDVEAAEGRFRFVARTPV